MPSPAEIKIYWGSEGLLLIGSLSEHFPRTVSDPKGTCEAAGYAAGTNLNNPGTDFKVTCSSSWLPGTDLTVTATYPYSISLLGWVVSSGQLTSTMKERVE